MAADCNVSVELANKKKRKRDGKLDEIRDIHIKTKEIFKNRQNVNLLVDILQYCQSDDDRTIQAAVESLDKLFSHFVSNHEWLVTDSTNSVNADVEKTVDDENNKHALHIYNHWMRDKYLACQRHLISLVEDSHFHVQETALDVLMKFVSTEARAVLSMKENGSIAFPNMLFYRIIEALISNVQKDDADLIARFADRFLNYSDIVYYTLKNIGTLMALKYDKSTKGKHYGDLLVRNVFRLLRLATIPLSDQEISSFYITYSNKTTTDGKHLAKLKEAKAYKKVYTKAWLNFLRLQLPLQLYKKVLGILHSEVMPNMTNPKLLIDFLTDSYNIGGTVSILAINGLFILIHEHNLDYPDFYKKLYALIQPEAFTMKSCGRFFCLLDLFLTSTHLPAYVVAAFAKKLCRVALKLNPAGKYPSAMIAIIFVCNLIKRHKSIQILIHRTTSDDNKEILDDPYLPYEEDPSKCRAMESSLWEFQILKTHYYPDVATLIEAFEKPISSVEIDIAEYTDQTTKSILEKLLTCEIPEDVALEFKPPNKFIPCNNLIWKLWSSS